VPRPKLVTPAVINQIELWVNDGLSAATIAEKVGGTLGTLRARCSQFGSACDGKQTLLQLLTARARPDNAYRAPRQA
jgi:hypothetical protein